MQLVSQNRKVVLNLDNCLGITQDGPYIHVRPDGSSQPVALARYSTESRADLEFARLIDALTMKINVFYLAGEEEDAEN